MVNNPWIRKAAENMIKACDAVSDGNFFLAHHYSSEIDNALMMAKTWDTIETILGPKQMEEKK